MPSFSDDFNRADEALQPPYAIVLGSPVVSGNRARGSSVGTDNLFYFETFLNGSVRLDFPKCDSSQIWQVDMRAFFDGDYTTVRVEQQAGAISIVELVNSSVVADDSVAVTLVDGDQIFIELNGDSLTVTQVGVGIIISRTLTDVLGIGEVGINLVPSGAAGNLEIDNLIVLDFEGFAGPWPAAGSLPPKKRRARLGSVILDPREWV